jgi:hypothetical protein
VGEEEEAMRALDNGEGELHALHADLAALQGPAGKEAAPLLAWLEGFEAEIKLTLTLTLITPTNRKQYTNKLSKANQTKSTRFGVTTCMNFSLI